MGAFGPFKCAYCGRTFRGLSWKIKNGKVVCGQCCGMFKKDWPYDEWRKLSITQIREHYDEKARLDSQTTCSYCGKPFDSSDIYKIVLKDKSQICYKCAEGLRVAFRVFCTEEKKGYDEFVPAFDDPLAELTLDDLPAAFGFAEEERRIRQERYGMHNGVFVVDDVARIKDKDGSERHVIWGRQVLGSTAPGEVLCVKRREMPYYITVSKLLFPKYNEKAKILSEGHDGGLEVPDDVSFVYSGDALISDERAGEIDG